MISALLAQTWIAFAIEADNAFEAHATERTSRLFRISLAMWTNGLRCIDGGGTTVSELRASAHANCNLGGLERWGWIRVGPDRETRGDGYGTQRGIKAHTLLQPTRAGVFARRVWPEVVGRVEEQWRARFGTTAIAALQAALGNSPGAMPWSPPEVHASDGFRTHVVDAPPIDDSDAPLVARLGRALTALTVEHERTSAVSLPLSAVVLEAIDANGVAVRDLPARTGISKEAVTMAVNWLTKHGFAILAERTLRLTDAGDSARAERCTQDDKALRDALQAVLAQTDALVAGLTPPPGCWRGEKPYVAQTKRVLANPTGALPRHPFVLHRGGWPDGS